MLLAVNLLFKLKSISVFWSFLTGNIFSYLTIFNGLFCIYLLYFYLLSKQDF